MLFLTATSPDFKAMSDSACLTPLGTRENDRSDSLPKLRLDSAQRWGLEKKLMRQACIPQKQCI